jgi:hypothetical protein
LLKDYEGTDPLGFRRRHAALGAPPRF